MSRSGKEPVASLLPLDHGLYTDCRGAKPLNDVSVDGIRFDPQEHS